MTTAVILWIAASLAAVQGIAHGALFLRAKPRHGPAEVAVIEAMKSNRFDFAGVTRSYWEFYFGYGLEAAAVCLIEAILLVQLASIAELQPAVVRPVIALCIGANLGHAVLTARYFFYVPIVFDVAIASVLAWAFVVAGR